ncbi:TatD family hydrolase, partial [candidate division WOR-3 bacterium]|nr:TatD family hydrolase [candidate division WOR-3 bacterium]
MSIKRFPKQLLAEAVPLKNMLLESDAPVLGPERGKRNEPKNIVLTLSKLSEIKQVPIK